MKKVKKKTSKKAAVKKTATKARIPRYVDTDGLYLVVEDGRRALVIAWYDPVEGDTGLILDTRESRPEEDETAIAIEACKRFFDEHKLEYTNTFEFQREKTAKECLRFVNAELWAWKSNRPWPEWAKTAIANGWSPPKGWSA